ncbi:NAD/NADP-dependent octopine/nopaline dehydrogenase family protein [Nocardia brasiliensis]|uniref:Opine dehydrogenase n=1 Tax=Nocardia brasiliensis (strain ATCC 700358 / HUJEG-1) TaxID=1133849 RepID=K0ER77_NOCB7|nr:NAD/NADP-dependent octopine/nopaline dehydrogenase family protein [Nocardia brasiliensis]AFU02273.1 Opine dehydrogenase [Nocardia brasiliensis ATCC 700358]
MGDKSIKAAVLGAGDAGRALAAVLARAGCEVRLWNRTAAHLADIEDATLTLRDPDACTVRLAAVSTDLAAVCSGADLVLVAISAAAHRDLVTASWPALRQAAAVVLVPGHTGGVLEVTTALRDRVGWCESALGPALAEMNLPFVCRGEGSSTVRIFQYKKDVPLGARQRRHADIARDLLARSFPAVRSVGSIWETSLANVTAVIQPVVALANLARLDHGDRHRFYAEGVSAAVARIIEASDRERVLLGREVGVRLPTALEWFGHTYECTAPSLVDALRAAPGYRSILAPRGTDHRFLDEHVRTGAVPLAALAALVGTPHRQFDAIVTMASAATGRDLYRNGRTLHRMGIGSRMAIMTLTGASAYATEGTAR